MHVIEKTIFREMITHPAFFTHPHPKKILLIEDEQNAVLPEVLKHALLTHIFYAANTPPEYHEKIQWLSPQSDWLTTLAPASIDIIINSLGLPENTLYPLLHSNGIMISLSDSFFNLPALKTKVAYLKTLGFNELQLIHFPQPLFETGWRAAFMAIKDGTFRRIKEKMI